MNGSCNRPGIFFIAATGQQAIGRELVDFFE
jgi:hypothetical protein